MSDVFGNLYLQMIGTSISLQNADLVLYPSVTICSDHDVARWNRDVQGNVLYDSSSSDQEIFNLTHTPDMSDVLLSLNQTYGPITNMSEIILTGNTSSFIGTPTAMEKRDIFCHLNINILYLIIIQCLLYGKVSQQTCE